MKTVTRSLLLSYSPISSDQLVVRGLELYCIARKAEFVAAFYIVLVYTKRHVDRCPNKKTV